MREIIATPAELQLAQEHMAAEKRRIKNLNKVAKYLYTLLYRLERWEFVRDTAGKVNAGETLEDLRWYALEALEALITHKYEPAVRGEIDEKNFPDLVRGMEQLYAAYLREIEPKPIIVTGPHPPQTNQAS